MCFTLGPALLTQGGRVVSAIISQRYWHIMKTGVMQRKQGFYMPVFSFIYLFIYLFIYFSILVN